MYALLAVAHRVVEVINNPFGAALEWPNIPEASPQLLQEREQTFKEYREGDQGHTRGILGDNR